MTPREFFNGWIGYDNAKREYWDILFYNARYNAIRTATHKKQMQQVVKDKAPWYKKRKTKEMSNESIQKMLDFISK